MSDLAGRVWEVFGDVLDTDDGGVAMQAAAVRMLRRIALSGDYPDLEAPLRRLAADPQPAHR